MKAHIFSNVSEDNFLVSLMRGRTWNIHTGVEDNEIAAPYLCEIRPIGDDASNYHYNDIPLPFIAFNAAGTATTKNNVAKTGVTDQTLYVNVVYGTVTLTTDVDWITLSNTAVTSADTAITYTVTENPSNDPRTGHITGTYSDAYFTREFVCTVNQLGFRGFECRYRINEENKEITLFTGGTDASRDKIEVYSATNDEWTLIDTLTPPTAGTFSYTFATAGTYVLKFYRKNGYPEGNMGGRLNPVPWIDEVRVFTKNVSQQFMKGSSVKTADFRLACTNLGLNSGYQAFSGDTSLKDIYVRTLDNITISGGYQSVKTSSDLTVHYNAAMTEVNLTKLHNYFPNATFVADA